MREIFDKSALSCVFDLCFIAPNQLKFDIL